jgi:hypothetical protein
MSKYAVLGALVVVILVVGLFGYHFGYTVHGVPQGAEVAEGEPGILGVVEYVFGSIGFLLSMVSFRVDGMPIFIGTIFIFMGLMSLMLLISLVRGTD